MARTTINIDKAIREALKECKSIQEKPTTTPLKD